MELNEKQINELRECLELLQSIENILYHNKNWLATTNPKMLNEEKRSLINRAINIIGSSARTHFT